MQRSDSEEQPQQLTIRHVLAVPVGVLVCFGSATLVFNTWGSFLVPVTKELGVAVTGIGGAVALLIGIISVAVVSMLNIRRKMMHN